MLHHAAAVRRGAAPPQGEPTPQETARFRSDVLRLLQPLVARLAHEGHKTIKEAQVRAALGSHAPTSQLPTQHCKLKAIDAGGAGCFYFPKATFRRLVKQVEPPHAPPHRHLRWSKNAAALLQEYVETELLKKLH